MRAALSGATRRYTWTQTTQRCATLASKRACDAAICPLAAPCSQDLLWEVVFDCWVCFQVRDIVGRSASLHVVASITTWM